MTRMRGRLLGCALAMTLIASSQAEDKSLPPPADLHVRIVGTASFQGKFTALIEDLHTHTDAFYKVGDPIYGYKIAEISAEGVKLQKNGTTSYLAFDSQVATERNAASSTNHEVAAITPQSSTAGPNFYMDSGEKSTTRWDLFTPKKEQEAKRPSLAGTRTAAATASRTRFVLPVKSYRRFSSPFGYRKHPIGGGSKMHKGIDLSANRGTRILAADSGVVKFSGWKGGYGYCVIIDHQNGYETLYGHCSKLLADVGDNVTRGDLIAEVGSTGASTGNHLHFEVHKNGVAVNPVQYLPKL